MAGTDDEHTSPGARENGTPLDRQAADKAHESVHAAQTAANPSSGTDGEPLHKRPGGTRVVPEADAKLLGGPIYSAGSSGMQTRTFRLQYENAVNLIPVLRPIVSPNNPINPLSYTAVGRNLAATAELFERMTRRYGKPAFGIDETIVQGEPVPVVERVVWHKPFCNLLHFVRQSGQTAQAATAVEKSGGSVIVPGPVRAWCRIAHPLSLAGPNDPRQVNIAGFFLSSVESPCFRGFILKYSRAALSHAALRIP